MSSETEGKEAGRKRKEKKFSVRFRLGDMVESALKTVGITSERLEKALGRPCNCKRRKEMLNQLSDWALGIIGGEVREKEKAEEQLNTIIEKAELARANQPLARKVANTSEAAKESKS